MIRRYRRAQGGVAAVEFAVIGSAAITLLVICIEVGRMLYVWGTLGEATRQAARIAAVSAIGSSKAKERIDAKFAPFIADFSSSHVTISYLGADGSNLGAAPPAGSVKFVNVTVAGFEHELLIPPIPFSLDTKVSVPAFSTTLPAESLGIDPP